jgi:hypothetical protein
MIKKEDKVEDRGMVYNIVNEQICSIVNRLIPLYQLFM